MLLEVPERQLIPKTGKNNKIELPDRKTPNFSISITGIDEGSRELINLGYISDRSLG